MILHDIDSFVSRCLAIRSLGSFLPTEIGARDQLRDTIISSISCLLHLTDNIVRVNRDDLGVALRCLALNHLRHALGRTHGIMLLLQVLVIELLANRRVKDLRQIIPLVHLSLHDTHTWRVQVTE